MFRVHEHSLRVAQVDVLAQKTKHKLSSATGFWCNFKNKIFFVTNWHVVSGRNFETNKPVDRKTCALPGQLIIHGHAKQGHSTHHAYEFKIDLYDEHGNPTWKEHPDYGSKVDVVAIQLAAKSLNGFDIFCVDIDTELQKNIEINVMDQAFVTGYPLEASTTPNKFPIYKSGIIASEPMIFNSEPRFYIDGKTKKGYSGSPVVIKQKDTSNNESKINGFTHECLDFIGIYSGRDRQEETEFEAELGIVWPYKDCLLPILKQAHH